MFSAVSWSFAHKIFRKISIKSSRDILSHTKYNTWNNNEAIVLSTEQEIDEGSSMNDEMTVRMKIMKMK